LVPASADSSRGPRAFRHGSRHARNERGRVVGLATWRLVDFWKMTAAMNPDDLIFADAWTFENGKSSHIERLTMKVIDHNAPAEEKWRDGVMTQMRMSIMVGGRQLCIFEQFCHEGLGAPIHIHAVEEVLEVIDGRAEIFLGSESAIVTTNQSVLIPAGVKHGFRNLEKTILHVRATLAAPIFEASYENGSETARRWSPG
jgi:mannose-6-phosphate isomerase-like protein (cupin superfamily)